MLVKYPIVVPPESLLRQYNELVQDIVAAILNMVFRGTATFAGRATCCCRGWWRGMWWCERYDNESAGLTESIGGERSVGDSMNPRDSM